MQRGWQIQILTTKGQRSALAPLVFAGALLRVLILGIGGRVDLLHLNMSSRGSAVRKLLVGSTARLVGIPYVIQLHGGGFERFHRELPGPGRLIIRWFFSGAGQVFVLGEPFARLVRDEIGVPADRVAILRNAVSVPAQEIGGHDAGSEPPLVLFTGRIGPGKGVPELLDALARLAEVPWRAVVAGDGDVDGTRSRVTELGLDQRIEVRGWQSRDQIDELLRATSVFVLPSHLEALSVSLLEAMAEGICCIATPVGAHPEVVDHDRNGLLVDPGDVDGLTEALGRAITDPDLRARLGAAARASVEACCSTEVVAGQLLATYERMLASS